MQIRLSSSSAAKTTTLRPEAAQSHGGCASRPAASNSATLLCTGSVEKIKCLTCAIAAGSASGHERQGFDTPLGLAGTEGLEMLPAASQFHPAKLIPGIEELSLTGTWLRDFSGYRFHFLPEGQPRGARCGRNGQHDLPQGHSHSEAMEQFEAAKCPAAADLAQTENRRGHLQNPQMPVFL